MKKLFIKNARVNVDEGGIACGPVGGPIAAELQLRDEDGKEFFLTLAEVDGLPALYKTDESNLKYHSYSIYDELPEDEVCDFFDELNEKHLIHYEDYSDMINDTENDLYDAFRYLIYLVRCDCDEEKEFLSKTIGKYLEEIEIPVSDIEEDYLEEEEDDE